MRTFRFIALLIVASVITSGSVRGLRQQVCSSPGSEITCDDFQKVIAGEDSDQDDGLKRKRKPRCIEVTVTQIAEISFEQAFVYKAGLIPAENKICSLSPEAANCKRGPPELSASQSI